VELNDADDFNTQFWNEHREAVAKTTAPDAAPVHDEDGEGFF
jgi:hypothetical protein